MIKKLLSLAAIAAVAINANAEAKVLWEDAEGFKVEWGTGIVISKEDAAANVKAGDVLIIDVSAVNTESGWPQVQLNANTTDPENPQNMLFIACEGGLSVPTVISFPILSEAADLFKEYGIQIQGDGQTITKVSVETGTIEIGPNTVWFGPKTLENWASFGVSAGLFKNVAVGNQIQVEYQKIKVVVDGEEKMDAALGIRLGGWSGLDLRTYEAGKYDFMKIDDSAETIIATVDLVESLSAYNTADDKTLDVFSLLKKDGLVVQGVGNVLQVKLIPAATTGVETISSVESSVLYNIFGQPVDDNYRGIVIKNGKKIMKK